MMATGGYCVVVPNGGNIEYLRDEENCLLYSQGDIEAGVRAIYRICEDANLRDRRYEGGIQTAKIENGKIVRIKFYNYMFKDISFRN